jgi:regulator of nucleoside diphosphate kinase
LQELQGELERAVVLDPAEVPEDVIRMHSKVGVLDLVSGERSEYALVFPAEGNPAANRISVLAPLGTALLGYREGDEVEWMMPGGPRRLRVERVLQPGATRSAGSAFAADHCATRRGMRQVAESGEIVYVGSGT